MTIKQIAKLAGTSRGTVDRVLNGRGNVNPELAEKIRTIAEENGYKPNQLARALVNSRKHFVIGIIINSLGNPFFADVLEGINRRAREYENYGLRVLVKEIRGYEEREQLDAISEMNEKGVDGLAITPLDYPQIAERLNALTIPVVTFNTDLESVNRLAFVGCDYINSGSLTGDVIRLVLQGGGRVGIVIGSKRMSGHMQRVEGVRQSLAGAKDIEIVAIAENSDDEKRSYEVTRELIRKENPDLIYFAAAGIEGGVRAVLESEKSIRVLTVDETEFTKGALHSGVITATVTQQPEKQGDRAVEILYNYLSLQKKPSRLRYYTKNHVKLKSSK